MGYLRPVRIRIQSIGCRLNTGEMAAISRSLVAAGCQVVPAKTPADICILNTCTVTAIAARKSRQAIRRLRREFPDSFLVVTGCDSELEPERSIKAGADLAVPNADKERIADLLMAAGVLAPVDPAQSAPGAQKAPQGDAEPLTRTFVKVQDGCDHSCAYCIVTIARGPAQSRAIEDVISEVSSLEATGFKEIVLTGVHLGSYGHDEGNRSGLERLVRELLDRTTVPRLRLSSIEPWDVTAGLLDAFDNPRLLPHLHLPLQSGSDATLRRMARRMTRADFRALVNQVRATVPNVAISTDVMVGFPGETEEEFIESRRFVEEMVFSQLHVFRFSPRERTAAAAMPNQVQPDVVLERSQQMLELGKVLLDGFARDQLGLCVPVLWEDCVPDGDRLRWRGLTPNYVRVFARVPRTSKLGNRIIDTRLSQALPGEGLLGFLEDESLQRTDADQTTATLPVIT